MGPDCLASIFDGPVQSVIDLANKQLTALGAPCSKVCTNGGLAGDAMCPLPICELNHIITIAPAASLLLTDDVTETEVERGQAGDNLI